MKNLKSFDELNEKMLNEGLRFNAVKSVKFAKAVTDITQAMGEVDDVLKFLNGKGPETELSTLIAPKDIKDWMKPSVKKSIEDLANTLYDWKKETDAEKVRGFGNEELIPLW